MAISEIPVKQPILGILVSATSYSDALRWCREWIDERRQWRNASAYSGLAPPGRGVFLCTVHSVMTGVLHSGFRSVLNSADIAATDGMPLAWALRSFGVRGQPRVYGPDLMLALCEQAARLGHRVFLYGGREATLPVLCRRLRERFPGLVIAGAFSPPFRPLDEKERADCVRMIADADPDIIFVGIGAPKQERWIVEHRDVFPGVVMLGVGAAFDFHAGRVKQAPRWMQQAGLEWLFRLLMEPKRLWKRYLLLNPLFLVMWGMQKSRILRYGNQVSRPT